MSDENKPTVVGDTDPWSRHDEEKPTVIDDQAQAGSARSSDARTVAADGRSPFEPTHPQQRSTPTSPFSSTPQPRRAPPQAPRDAGAQGGARTVMMQAKPEIIPLAWIAVVDGVGDPRGTVYTLLRETLLGRKAGDIIINDPAVSGQHMKIRLEPDEDDPEEEVFVLYDLASANGVYVGEYDACQAEANRVYRHPLQDGDYIRVGRTILIFKQA